MANIIQHIAVKNRHWKSSNFLVQFFILFLAYEIYRYYTIKTLVQCNYLPPKICHQKGSSNLAKEKQFCPAPYCCNFCLDSLVSLGNLCADLVHSSRAQTQISP